MVVSCGFRAERQSSPAAAALGGRQVQRLVRRLALH
jgi:hypothetical protein